MKHRMGKASSLSCGIINYSVSGVSHLLDVVAAARLCHWAAEAVSSSKSSNMSCSMRWASTMNRPDRIGTIMFASFCRTWFLVRWVFIADVGLTYNLKMDFSLQIIELYSCFGKTVSKQNDVIHLTVHHHSHRAKFKLQALTFSHFYTYWFGSDQKFTYQHRDFTNHSFH